MRVSDKEFRCNICNHVLMCDDKSMDLFEHIKDTHEEVYNLHKDNMDNSVGYRIEFLHLNGMKDDDDDPQTPIIIGEVCEATTEEIAKPITGDLSTEVESQLVLTKKRKVTKSICSETRRRSWVWKYFEKIDNVMYKCTLCTSVLSIKGCNTNNMNRHVRTKHQSVYLNEMIMKKDDLDQSSDYEISFEEEKVMSDKDDIESPNPKARSWIWMYFNRLSSTLAQCKICTRKICHGGNATGNMNRHLKMLHNKYGDEHTWIWKVFDASERDFYTCKICQFQCMKLTDLEKNINYIRNHLRVEHGVISGDQIITSSS